MIGQIYPQLLIDLASHKPHEPFPTTVGSNHGITTDSWAAAADDHGQPRIPTGITPEGMDG